jgi:hypothetical protein
MDPEPVGRPVRQRLPQRLQAPVRRGMRGPVGGEHAPRPSFPDSQQVPSTEGALTMVQKSHAMIARSREVSATPCAQSELKCFCGALGAIG